MAFAFGGVGLTVTLVAADALAITTLWLLAYEIRYTFDSAFLRPINEDIYYAKALAVVVPMWLMVLASWGHYTHRERRSSLAQVRHVLGAFKDGLIASFALAFLLREYELGRSVVGMSAVLICVWVWATRAGLRYVRQRALEHGIGLRRALVVGTGETARRAVARLATHREIGYDLVGVVAVDPASHPPGRLAGEDVTDIGPPHAFDKPVLGFIDDLREIIQRERVEEVFLAAPELDNNRMLNAIARCNDLHTNFKTCSNIMEVITDRVKIDDINDLPVIPFRRGELPAVQAVLKRLLDVVVAGGLLLVFALPMLVIAAIIRATCGAPVLFRQQRVGRHGRAFTILKFRTMTVDTRPYDVAPTDPVDPRITWIGRFLRRTSLDELPQLINVLRGDMSMVGPRPEMPFIVDQYEPWQRERLKVRPGITGLWQIIGRKNLPLHQHLEYDFYYIKNQSLLLDILIILRTIPAVILGRGAY